MYFAVLFYIVFVTVTVDARKIFGRKDVHVVIPREVSRLVRKSLTEMNTKFDKDPMQSAEFKCKNQATEKLLSMYPEAVIRWMHNGENIKVFYT